MGARDPVQLAAHVHHAGHLGQCRGHRRLRVAGRGDQAAPGVCAVPCRGSARIPAGTPNMCSQACEMTEYQVRVATCAYSAATESVSTAGATVAPAAAKSSSRIRRLRISGDSRHSGTAAASAQPAEP